MRLTKKFSQEEARTVSLYSISDHLEGWEVRVEVEKERGKIGENWFNNRLDVFWYVEGMIGKTSPPQYHLEALRARGRLP